MPLNSGYAMRTLSILRALAAMGGPIDFVSFASEPVKDLEPLSSLCATVETVPLPHKQSSKASRYLGRAAALLLGKSYALHNFSSAEMRTVLERRLANEHYDLILADGLHVLFNLPETRVPVVLNSHNVEWLILDRYAALERNPAKRTYARIEADRLRDAERAACARITMALVCSACDGDLLRQLRADLPVFVVPNCVDVEPASAGDGASGGDSVPTLLFQGVMEWYPNFDAASFFVSKIFPAIKREVPQARFVIAGRNPPEHLRAECAKVAGVEVTGTVPDMKPYVARTTVAVVPLRLGSGTRLKILEAAAAGKPVVSTSVGAEGLDFQSGKEIVIADDPDRFARETVELLRDAGRRAAMGRAAHAKVLRNYSQDAVTQAFKAALATLKA